MRLSTKEVEDFNIDIKAWTGALQSAARGKESPEFTLSGPCQLAVRRKRNTKSGALSTVSGRMNFSGGESFKLGSVSVSKLEGFIQIDVSFVSVNMELIAAISGMTMTMQQATEVFDGFGGWIDSMRESMPSVVASKPKPKSLAQQHADNPLWGSW